MEERTIDLCDLMRSLIKKWWVIGLIAILGCATGLGAGAYKNNQYNKNMEKERIEKQKSIDLSDLEEGNVDEFFKSALSATDIETVKRVINNEQYLQERKEYISKLKYIDRLDPEQYWYVHSIEDSIVSTRASINKDKESFTDAMETYYDFLLGVDETVNVKELADLSTIEEEVFVPKSLINKKYAVLGFVAGLFIAACVLAIIYIVDPRVRTCDDIKRVFGINLISLIENKKSLSLEADSIALACSAIELRMKKNNISKLSIIGCNMEKDGKNYAELIKNNLKDEDIDIVNRPIFEAAEISKLSNAESVILLEKANCTKCTEIEAEIDLCKDTGIKVLGIIMLA